MKLAKIQLYSDAITGALLRTLFEFVVFFVIYFLLLGRNTNIESAIVFFGGFFIFAVFVIPVQVRFDYLKRFTAGHGGAEKNTHKNLLGKIILANVWLDALKPMLIIGLPGALISPLVIAFLQPAPWPTVVSFLSVLTLAVVGVTVKSFPEMLSSANNRLAVNFPEQTPPSLDQYMFSRHIVPWSGPVVLVSLVISFKYSQEVLFIYNTIPCVNAALSIGLICYLFCLWMWYESYTQARIEVKFSGFSKLRGYSLRLRRVVLLIHGMAFLAIVLVGFIGYLFFASGFSPTVYILSCTAWGFLGGVAGNIAGIQSALAERSPQNTLADQSKISS